MTGPRRPRWLKVALVCLAAAAAAAMVLLGNWQLRRLDWKVDLIAAVETRAYQKPVAAPRGQIDAATQEYLRVAARGHFRHHLSRRVKALTELGGGYWLMTPLQTSWGYLWINRGFVPAGSDATAWQQPEGALRVEGLARVSQPDGTLLEKNDPENGRWYSRDVAALSADADLVDAVDYFIDADHAAGPQDWPRGGLTRLKFRNTHLSYAITWYALAALLTAAMFYVIRREVAKDP